VTLPVCVVVPCHDYGRFLPESVGSVLGQTFGELELLIVDDGSTDDSLDVARSLAREDSRVRVHAQPCCGYPGLTRNAGIERTEAPYVLCLDADDRLAPDFVERCLHALETRPDRSIAHGDQQHFGADTAFHRHHDSDFALLTRVNTIATACLFRREAWAAAGGYPPMRGYEDWDFWISCGERGHHGLYVPGAVFHYRTKADGLFAEAVELDRGYKARIVLNHPRLYSTQEVEWAATVVEGRETAGVEDVMGEIPRLGGVPPYWSGAEPFARGAYAVAVQAKELVADSRLAAAVAELPADVTVVLADGASPDGDPLPGLEQALDGLDDRDLLATSLPYALLAQHVDAVLTLREPPAVFSGLPRAQTQRAADVSRTSARTAAVSPA
jgi:hypothetical protein